jgi:SAM-dependent methyltransferase
LREFYIHEYRNLYMEAMEISEDYFQDMVRRGEEILSLFHKQASLSISTMKVLEIGCSAGGILLPFRRAGAAVKGYDYDERYLNYGNRYDASLNLCFGGLDNLKTEQKHDLIIINHVLEHLSDPRKAIALARNCLKDQGYLYIGVPGLRNTAYYASPSKSFLGSLHIGHLYHFTEQSLSSIAEGFQVRYIDDKICALFQTAARDAVPEPAVVVSEYASNVGFIRDYETGFTWKVKRLAMIMTNLLSNFILRVIPIGVRKTLKSLLNPKK